MDWSIVFNYHRPLTGFVRSESAAALYVISKSVED